jgi:NAD(P)-dependent dehydrogenase (short-subunit alcohol dehydrogenase family)
MATTAGGDATMAGRVCMITGASSGIGRATARGLAQLGASLVLVCRDRGRGEETLAEVRAGGSPEAELMLADLSSQAEIRRLAREFLDAGKPLHVLINNAGVVNTSRTVTADGIETVFAVNHLAYFLLTQLLLDRLRQSAPARIVNVASEAHRFGPMNFDDLQSEKSFRTMRVYGQSKMANILFTYELARRLGGTGVTVNCLHPGTVATGLGKNNGAVARFFANLLAPFFRTPVGGAATSIHLASAPELANVSGQYFRDRLAYKSAAASYSLEDARRLWQISEAMTGTG